MPRYFVTYKRIEGEEAVMCREFLGWFQNEDMAAAHAHYQFSEPGVSIVGVAADAGYYSGPGSKWGRGIGRAVLRVLRIVVAGFLVYYLYENFLEFPLEDFDVPVAQITGGKIFSVFRDNWVGIVGILVAWVIAFGRGRRR